MTGHADIIVIGAGVHGACTAMNLAARGLKVAMLDKYSGGRHSSTSNAGGVRRLMRDTAEVPLAVEASRLWKRIRDLVDDDCGYRETGQVYLAENADDMKKLEARLTQMRALGYEHEELIDGRALKALIPALSDVCAGALMVRDDGFASPFRTTQAFQRKAVANGVDFHTNEPVLALARQGGCWSVTTPNGRYEAAIVINCAGAWGDQVAAMVGDHVPISAEAPTMMVTAPVPHFLDPVVCHISKKLSFKQAPSGIVLIGGGYRGTLDRDAGTTRVDFLKLRESAQTVINFFPVMKNAPVVRAWAGIEGLTPDRIPAIGPSPKHDGLFHAFGFSSHGFQLAPVVGRLMSELIVDGRSSIPLDAFSLRRFEEKQGV
jgi:sarcosine oxidase subunit beta